jgi:hypothetical protein
VTGGKLVRHAACVVRKGFWLVGWMSGSWTQVDEIALLEGFYDLEAIILA